MKPGYCYTNIFLFQNSTITSGALTRKLKERLKEGGGGEGEPSTVTMITEAQRRREREMVKKEVEKLQKGIQTLCQSTNPLGKIMDYVQASRPCKVLLLALKHATLAIVNSLFILAILAIWGHGSRTHM